jgi:hypothetical protein
MTKQEQSMRLYQAVERLALQAGEDTDETIDWLCGEHGGMAKLFEAHFSPKVQSRYCPNCEALSKEFAKLKAQPALKPLTDEQIDALSWGPHEGNPMTFAEGLRDFARAIEAAHGITEKGGALWADQCLREKKMGGEE